jgi:hypothetical protein
MKIEIITDGVSEIREMTAEEKTQAEKYKKEFEQLHAAEIAAYEAKEAARAALLDKLGITADEAKLLLG